MGSASEQLNTGNDNALRQAREIRDVLTEPKTRSSLKKYGTLIAIVMAASTVALVHLIDWQREIIDTISTRKLTIFFRQVAAFFVIASVLLLLRILLTWLQERLKVRLREALSKNVLAEWLKSLRLMPLAGDLQAPPDQSIAEVKRLAELTVDLGFGLLQSFLLFFAYIWVLWQLSNRVVFSVVGIEIIIPGYFVLAVIGYAACASFVTWILARPLFAATEMTHAVEKHLRSELGRVRDASDEIVLSRGEIFERAILADILTALFTITRSIANRVGTLCWIKDGSSLFAIIAPLFREHTFTWWLGDCRYRLYAG